MKTHQRLSTLLMLTSLALLCACDSGAPATTSPIHVGNSTGTTGGGVLPLPGTGTGGSTGGGGGGGGGGITNSLPVALADVAVVQLGSTANPINVLLNDSDANGDSLTITAVSLILSVPSSGTGTTAIAPDGKTLRYTPPTGFVGTQTLRYTVSDGKGGVASALAVVTVSPLALPPAALPDVFTNLVNAPISTLDVLANDVDGAGGGLVVNAASSLATIPAGNAGTVSVVNGALRYQAAAGFIGVETLSYTLSDTNGATATAVAVITVLPLAAPPVALPDVVALAAGASGNIDVLANDVDLAGGGLTLNAVSALGSVPPGGEGSFAIVNNRVVYIPASPTFIGTQTASYSVLDQNGSTATGLLTLVVTPAAPVVPPLAVADLVTLSSGSTTANLNVLTNDIDVAGGGLTITVASVVLGLPDSTGVTVTTDGSALQLALPSTYAGVLTLSYTITDSNGSTSTTAVIVTVAPAALPVVPPVALPDVFIQASGSTSTTLDVLANDIDVAGGGLTITAASVALGLPDSSGVSVGTSGSDLQLSLPSTYVGVLTLNYTVTDTNGGTASTVVAVTVTPAGLPGISPLALPDVATVAGGTTSTNLNVLTNDIDVAGGGLTITVASVVLGLPDSTGVTVTTDGSALQLALPSTYAGVLTLSYTITDSNGSTSTTAVIVTVAPAALPVVPPVALPDVFIQASGSTSTTLDVLANDIDVAGGGLTITAASVALGLPDSSGVSVGTSGSDLQLSLPSTYAGVLTLNYTVTDTNGGSASTVVVITVTPAAVSGIPPLALPDVVTLSSGDTAATLNVLSNDLDVAGGGLTISAASVLTGLPDSTGVTVSTDGSALQLALPSTYTGVLTLSYTITDSNGSTSTTVAVVTVSPVALPAVPPVPLPDLATVSQDSSATSIDVLANDIDPAAGGLTLSATSTLLSLPVATHTVAIVGNQLQFTPAAGFAGVVTLSYTITDSNGSTGTTAVIVTVSPLALPTVPPVPVPDLATVSQDSSATSIDVLANDIDPAAGGLTLSAASTLLSLPVATHTVAIVGNQLQFTPAAGFAGVVTVTYTVTDANGATGNGLLTLTVSPISPIPLPLALNDLGSLQVLSLLGTTGSFDVLANDIDPAGGGLTLQSVNFQDPLLVTVGSLLGIVGNQVELTVPLLGLIAGVLPIDYVAVDSLGRTVTGVLNVTLFP